MLCSLRNPIDKADSFSSEVVFLSDSLFAKKTEKLFVNDSDNKENKDNVDVISQDEC